MNLIIILLSIFSIQAYAKNLDPIQQALSIVKANDPYFLQKDKIKKKSTKSNKYVSSIRRKRKSSTYTATCFFGSKIIKWNVMSLDSDFTSFILTKSLDGKKLIVPKNRCFIEEL